MFWLLQGAGSALQGPADRSKLVRIPVVHKLMSIIAQRYEIPRLKCVFRVCIGRVDVMNHCCRYTLAKALIILANVFISFQYFSA